ncbi:hypothetical protein [Plasmodium yoelii yoelii]|uniref:Uncharacterized protein n=1 Tax=Plasmodium yoelii yoelii TaxID=73239 RepID=Q7RSC9_PLAYO|nr:hypothetical protein [Plasmodium yoelii yoelii]
MMFKICTPQMGTAINMKEVTNIFIAQW